MAGYSETPLIKKLGIKSGFKIVLQNEPLHYLDWISPLPEGIRFLKNPVSKEVDFIHLFVKESRVFEREFIALKKKLSKEGMMWISWPKKASKVATDLDETVIRGFGLANGLVDVKVCAVDEVWSGLKFVYRIKDR